MKPSLILLLCVIAVCLPAQTPPEAKVQTDALKLRGEMAETVGRGSEKADAAIERLKKEKSPTGLKFGADADFALAAIDVGQRLIALGKPTEAEEFFQEAEKSLGQAIKKAPDKAVGEIALLLEHRAYIRTNFLNSTAEAELDLEKAVKLQPDDKRLQRKREHLAARKTDRGGAK